MDDIFFLLFLVSLVFFNFYFYTHFSSNVQKHLSTVLEFFLASLCPAGGAGGDAGAPLPPDAPGCTPPEPPGTARTGDRRDGPGRTRRDRRDAPGRRTRRDRRDAPGRTGTRRDRRGRTGTRRDRRTGNRAGPKKVMQIK